MPRQARIVIAGECYHVTQRGNYRQNVFMDDRDRACYLRLIEKYREKYGLEVFAYCLMDNHVHFIVRPREENSLSQVFCRAHQQYSLYFHQKRKTAGHLWQERFYSCLLSERHFSAAVRYVERNPVRAGIVECPWDYFWSSAKAHMGTEYKIITLADVSELIEFFSWSQYVGSQESDKDLGEIRNATRRGLIWGPEEFVSSVEKRLKRRILPQPRGRPRK